MGTLNAGAIRRVEEDLGRSILWDICILHTNERPSIKYFMYCDYKGKKSKSTCPSHDGFIGKQFKDKKLELKDIVKKFTTISYLLTCTYDRYKRCKQTKVFIKLQSQKQKRKYSICIYQNQLLRLF